MLIRSIMLYWKICDTDEVSEKYSKENQGKSKISKNCGNCINSEIDSFMNSRNQKSISKKTQRTISELFLRFLQVFENNYFTLSEILIFWILVISFICSCISNMFSLFLIFETIVRCIFFPSSLMLLFMGIRGRVFMLS